MHCRQQRNRLLSHGPTCADPDSFCQRGSNYSVFFSLFLMMSRDGIRILLYAGRHRPASETPFEWRQMAFCWRADTAGQSLNARMITVIFQGVRIRIAEKPYIFVIFRWRGGRLYPWMYCGRESFGVRPFLLFFIVEKRHRV